MRNAVSPQGAASWLADKIAQLLDGDEREAVLGDLVEAGESTGQILLGVVNLVMRRQLAMWRHWRPWLAAFGLAIPGSFILMGFSISVSQAYQHLINETVLKATGWNLGPGVSLLLCNTALLIGWAWTGGFAVGCLSRRTLWVSATLSFAPCVFCLERFHIESLSRLCLLLFLPPAVWGVRKGLRFTNMKLASAIVLAIGVTGLTIPTWSNKGAWLPNCALSWPAWYLVATARKPSRVHAGQSHGE